MTETLAQKAQRLGIKPAGAPVVARETLSQKAARLGIRPASEGPSYRVAPVPAPVEDRQTKIQRYKQEEQAAQAEAKKQGSVLGFAKNFGKALVSNLAPSEVGLGKSIANIATDRTGYGNNVQQLTNNQLQLQKLIREREAKGQDTTNLKRGFNSTQDIINENKRSLGEPLPSTQQVVGQLGGTALDVLTAGTYGKAAQTMKFGQLAPKATAPTVINAARQSAGLFTKQGGSKVAAGAGIGYGYDVTSGLAGNRGEDRTGANAFIPGLGTVIGAGVPIALGAEQSVKNFRNPTPEIRNQYIDDLERKYSEWTEGTKPGKKRVMSATQKTESLNRAGTEGNTPMRTLAESGVIPKTKGTKFDTFDQALKFRDEIGVLKEANRKALQEASQMTPPTSIQQLEDDAIKFARTKENINSGRASRMEKQIKKEFEILRREYPDGNLPLTIQDEIKSARWDNVFKNKGLVDADVLKKDSEYSIAKAFQKNIEKVSKQSGNPEVAQLNREIGDRLEASKFLQSLDGQTLKGGRVSKYVGTLIGSSLGQTIPGKILGAVGGNVAADILIKSSVSSPIRRAILSKIARENPQAYKATIKWLAEQDALRGNRLSLPAPRPLGSPENPIITPAPTTYEKAAQKIGYEKSPNAKQTNPAINNVSNIPKVSSQVDNNASVFIPKDTGESIIAGLRQTPGYEKAMADLGGIVDIAEAGSRNFAGYGFDRVVSSNKSTFPKWLPENLRSKKLMEKVYAQIEKGTLPKTNATKEVDLYKRFVNFIEDQVTSPEQRSLIDAAEQSGITKKPFDRTKQGGYVRNPFATKSTYKSKAKQPMSGEKLMGAGLVIAGGLGALNKIASDKVDKINNETANTEANIPKQAPKAPLASEKLQDFVPARYKETVATSTQGLKVKSRELAALIQTENVVWDERAVRKGGTDTGLGQHIDNAYKDINVLYKKVYGKSYDRKNGEENIKATALWLDHLLKQKNINTIYDAVGAYRMGVSGYNSYLKGEGTDDFSPAKLKEMVEEKQESFKEALNNV